MSNPELATTDFDTHELIPVDKTFFQLDKNPTNGWGWNRPLYFDRTSNVYRVLDFPTVGQSYIFGDLPVDGLHELELAEPMQYARDCFDTNVKFRIK